MHAHAHAHRTPSPPPAPPPPHLRVLPEDLGDRRLVYIVDHRRLVHACTRPSACYTPYKLLLHPSQAAATPLISCYYIPLQAAATSPYRLLLSPHLEPSPERADLFWVYGCPNGDTVLPMLRWIKQHLPFWNASVREGRARHVAVVGHEEGWAEVWQLLGRWLAGNGDHSNHLHGWDDLHPASPSRQIASIQLSGLSDFTAVGGKKPMRGVSPGAPCRVCFQPGKDIMVPGYPGVMDYPDDEGLPAFAYLFEVSE